MDSKTLLGPSQEKQSSAEILSDPGKGQFYSFFFWLILFFKESSSQKTWVKALSVAQFFSLISLLFLVIKNFGPERPMFGHLIYISFCYFYY